MQSGKIVIILVIIGAMVALATIIGYVGQGNVRSVPMYYTEKVEQTVIFEEVDGQVQLRAILGVDSEPNPTLISRTSFVYILNVINNGDDFHRLYIEGLNVQTDLLAPGENDTISVLATEEGVYNYYDKRQYLQKLGQLKIVTVVPSDEFQGFLKDMI